jgi:hypothetical protein
MLFGVIGGIIFIVTLSITEKIDRKEEIRKANEEGYEVYFGY